jgi:5-hydroxyisourate hydrolase-like protein (transthyretin family)
MINSMPVLALSLLLLLQISAVGTQQQPIAKGTIDGAVISAATGEPVSGAQVVVFGVPATALTGSAGGVLRGVLVGGVTGTATLPPSTAPALTQAPPFPAEIPAVTTGSDGRFSFKDLNSGAYRITVAANGFARQEYGERVPNAQGSPIYVTAGQGLKDLIIRLKPTGTVTGRILDDAGLPAVDVPVQLLRVSYSPQGKTLMAAAAANANDRGEYRLYGITPGRYYLGVGNAPGPSRRPGQPVNPNLVPGPGYAFSYYSGVADQNQALLIEVKSGSEFVADMRVARQRSYRVRGRVMDSRTGQAPPAVDVVLNYRVLNGGGGSFSQGNSYDPSSGNFELQNVIPGRYTVQAQIQGAVPPRPVFDVAGAAAQMAAAAARPVAQVPINVTDSDIEGLVLTLTTGVSIPGRLTVEGPAPSSLASSDRIRVLFQSYLDGLQNPAGSTTSTSQIGPDGTFHIDGVRDGEYLASIIGIPSGFYVKSIQFRGVDLAGTPFKFSASGTLEIVLRPGAAQVNGVVIDARTQPVAGVQAVLIPAQRSRTDLYKMAVTDQNGRFTITEITPGEYKLFSWEAIEQNGFFDPDFVKRYEGQGRSVRIVESSSESIEAKVIPASEQ